MEIITDESILPEDLSADETLEDETEGYRESVAFDGTDFVRDGANRLVTSDGVSAYEDWCRICLATEKGSLFCYPEDFGLDTSRIPNATSRGEVESILRKEITDALMADSYQRTDSIESIEFDWIDSDSVEVEISVRGVDDTTVELEVTI